MKIRTEDYHIDAFVLFLWRRMF